MRNGRMLRALLVQAVHLLELISVQLAVVHEDGAQQRFQDHPSDCRRITEQLGR